MNSERKGQMHRTSMYGTALFALAIGTLIAAMVTGSTWLGGGAPSSCWCREMMMLCYGRKSIPSLGRMAPATAETDQCAT